MIKSFGDPDVEALFHGERVRRWINIEKVVLRINDQFRVCFVWRDGHAHKVTVIDYH